MTTSSSWTRSSMRRRMALLVVTMLVGVPALWAMPWSRDMIVQPIVRPLLLMFRPAPGAVALGSPAPMTNEVAEKTLKNPFAATPENLAEGRKLYTRYCAVCHGTGGKGDGIVAGGALAPANLTAPQIQARGDGYFFGVMRNGVRTMAPYHESLEPQERWKVVLYVRELGKQQANGK